MVKIFNQICNNIPAIGLDIYQLNNDFLYNVNEIWNISNGFGKCYGYIKWRNIFYEPNTNKLKLYQITHKLFVNATSIAIFCSQPKPKEVNKYFCLSSILLDEYFFNESFMVLTSNKSKCKSILVFNYSNNSINLNELILKYTNKFKKYNLNIKIINHYPDIYTDKCKCLVMSKEN